MSSATQTKFRKDSWQSPKNARTLRAYMALQNQEIAGRLKELRLKKGNPSQEHVAQTLEVSARSYGAWESGETKPSWRSLGLLANFYGVSVEWILLGDTDRVTVNGTEPDQLAEIQAMLTELQAAVVRLASDNLTQWQALRALIAEDPRRGQAEEGD